MTSLTLEALQVLDAIERKGSFAAAARSLNRVPSALTYTVNKLEEDLGISLFQKQGRRSILTTAGQHLMIQGRQLLQAAEDLTDSTKRIATGWEPRLRIALDTVIPVDVILPAIKQLYEVQPDIEIEIVEEALGGTWEALNDDRVDLAIGAVNNAPAHRGIRTIDWQTIHFIFVAAANHPICKFNDHSQPISKQVVEQYRSVIIRDTSRHETPLSRGILSKEKFIYVENMSQKLQAHRLGIGIGFVPSFRVARYIKSGELLSLKVENEFSEEKSQLGWKISNRGQAKSFLVEHLMSIKL